MPLVQQILIAQAFASVFMAGLIWFVQVVHYPLFARVPAEGFEAYEREHTTRTSLVVIAPMLVELACASGLVLLAWSHPESVGAPGLPVRVLAVAGLALVLLIWCSTFLLQVPCHRRLVEQRDDRVIRRLVRTNALRTLGWSLRAVLAVYWLVGC